MTHETPRPLSDDLQQAHRLAARVRAWWARRGIPITVAVDPLPPHNISSDTRNGVPVRRVPYRIKFGRAHD